MRKKHLTCLLLIFYVNSFAQGPSTPPNCDQLTLVQCERFVVQELGKLKSSDFKSIISLSEIWGERFRTAYHASIKTGPSSSDVDQIEKKISDELDPMEKIKSKITEQLLNRYFSKLASWLKHLGSAPAQGFAIFLNPSETASTFDEVIHANNRVQDKLHELLEPSLRLDWKKVYSESINNASPQIKIPKS